jgi:hypothetical protein
MVGERIAVRAGIRRGPAGLTHAVATIAVTHWPLLIALAVVAMAGLPTLNFAYGPDQALFAYIGNGLAHGKTLYVDLWDVKPPGVFWVYALATRMPFGFHGVRAFDLLYTLVTVVTAYALAARWWGRSTGAVAGLLYGVVYVTSSGYWESAQADSFMVLPVILGVLAWEERGRVRGRRGALLAGLAFGVAFQFRPVIALLPLGLAVWDLWSAWGRREAMRRVLLLIAGAVLVQALTLLYLAAGGALHDYLYAQFVFGGHYARLGGYYFPDGVTAANFLPGVRNALVWFTTTWLLLTVPGLIAVFVGGVLRTDRAVRLAALLSGAAVLSVIVQTKFFIYHWHPVLALLAMLAAWTASAAWRALRRRLSRPRAVAVAVVVVGGLVLLCPRITDGLAEWPDLVRYVIQPSYRTAYYDRFGTYDAPGYSFRASEEVSDYIRARTRPGDTIFVWGYDPNVYVMTGRDSASRFLSFLPLMPPFAPERWRQEFVHDLEVKRAAYVLVQRGENIRWVTGRSDDTAAWVQQFTAFNDLLARDYVFDRRIEDYFIYRHR